jgi:type II secretory pathway component PulF
MTQSTNSYGSVGVLPPELSGELAAQPRGPSAATVRGNRSPAALSHPASSPRPSRRRRIPKRDVFSFTMQLAIMTRAGVDLASALESLARQCRSERLRDTLQVIHADVCAGKPVSNALMRHADVFGPTYVASVAAGEASGRLSEVLDQLARLQQGEMRLRSTLRSVLGYPILLASVSTLVLLGLTLFVLPQFGEIFEDFETPLPVITRVLLAVAGELRSRFWLWGALLVAAVIGLIALRKSDAGRRCWDRFVVNTRLLRDVTQSLIIGRSFRLMGIMIDSGVPLLESVRLVRSSITNSLFRDVFESIEEDLVNGRGMGKRLLSAEVVPDGAAEMMVTAESTGTLGMVTQLIGQHFEEEGETRLRGLVTLLEPIIIVFMGAVVALVVLAVMLPMFDLATLTQQGS